MATFHLCAYLYASNLPLLSHIVLLIILVLLSRLEAHDKSKGLFPLNFSSFSTKFSPCFTLTFGT